MFKILSTLFFFVFLCDIASAQVVPAEGSRLNYRRIGFIYPMKAEAEKYKVEIAEGTYYREDSFKKYIIKTENTKKDRVILDVPALGREYTWRATYSKSGKVLKSKLHHFTTTTIPETDTSRMRFRVLKPAVKYKDCYVFIDGNKTLYDMNGAPVWYLPMKDHVELGRSEVRDLKLSPQGTITFLKHDHGYEINYNGDTLWKTPGNSRVGGDTVERCHHEFTRRSNGHYMVLGTEAMFWEHRFGPGVDSDEVKSSFEGVPVNKKNGLNLKIDFGTLLEYNEAGELVWYWKSSDYFLRSDLVNYKPEHRTKVIDVHENAFFFDEDNSVIYISFKNISRILKVRYPDGKVLNAYGEVYKLGVQPSGNGLFCDQHACKHSKKGYLYLYNNNGCNDSSELPSILVMKESPMGNDSLIKVWEYKCTLDGVNINPNIRDLKARQKNLEQHHMKRPLDRGALLRATSGGNVIELPDHSIFVSMNTQYSKVFIVSPDKKILWSAVPERRNPDKNEWFITPQQYRASIITRKELDQLIWNAARLPVIK
jgi:hypothetical protein